MEDFFAVLGGMGTLATTNFLAEMNKQYSPKNDQDFFNYILFNHAEVPDRTNYILDRTAPDPLPFLLRDIKQINNLKPDFIVMPCNTAHYFIEELQAASNTPIINMIQETIETILRLTEVPQKIGLAATRGTISSGIYDRSLQKNGLQAVFPEPDLQEKIDSLIYTFVKERSEINLALYTEILEDFMTSGCDSVLLGCTELSLINSYDKEKDYPVIDAEKILLRKTIALASELKKK